MRSGRKFALIAGTLVALVASVVPASSRVAADSAPPSPSASASASASPAPSELDRLRAQRADLAGRLRTASGIRADAQQQLLAAESQLAGTQQRVADTQRALDGLDAQLRDLTGRISADEKQLSQARGQLAALLRVAYETSGSDGFAGAILSANDFSDAVDRIRSAQQVTQRVSDLNAQVTAKESGLLQEKADLQHRFADAQVLENTLKEDDNRLLQAVADRDIAFHQVDGPARDVASQLAVVDDRISALTAPPPPPPPAPVVVPDTRSTSSLVPTKTAGVGVVASAPCGNRFAFGNCTYYVATRRCIPWLGNAADWWGAAAAAGYAEGQTPVRGAVVVWGRGGSSPVGHVAFVEAVGPDQGIPAGSYLISEMNYNGFDRMNYRTLSLPTPGVLGFIYGPA